eukprot:g543.t1
MDHTPDEAPAAFDVVEARALPASPRRRAPPPASATTLVDHHAVVHGAESGKHADRGRHGYLDRRAGDREQWVRRFFRMHDHHLLEYKDVHGACAHELLASVDLSAAGDITADGDAGAAILIKVADGVPLALRASSVEDAAAWLAVLRSRQHVALKSAGEKGGESNVVAEAKAKSEAETTAKSEATAKREAEAKAKCETEAKAKHEAEAKAKREAEAKAKREAEAKAKHEAEATAKREAEAKAKSEAEAKAKREAEAKAKREAAAKAKREAEAKAKHEAEAKAKREAEATAKREAEAKAKREAEAKAKREAEAKAKREAAAKAKREAEAKAKREAEAKAKREAEAKAKREAEAKAKREAEEKAKREAEAKAKREATAKREAEAKAKREAEAKAKREAGAKAKREAEAKAKREAEAKAKREAGAKAKREAEAKAKREAEAKAKREAEAKAKSEATAKREAEARARREAEAKAKREAAAKAKREAAAKAKREAAARSKCVAVVKGPRKPKLKLGSMGREAVMRVIFFALVAMGALASHAAGDAAPGLKPNLLWARRGGGSGGGSSGSSSYVDLSYGASPTFPSLLPVAQVAPHVSVESTAANATRQKLEPGPNPQDANGLRAALPAGLGAAYVLEAAGAGGGGGGGTRLASCDAVDEPHAWVDVQGLATSPLEITLRDPYMALPNGTLAPRPHAATARLLQLAALSTADNQCPQGVATFEGDACVVAVARCNGTLLAGANITTWSADAELLNVSTSEYGVTIVRVPDDAGAHAGGSQPRAFFASTGTGSMWATTSAVLQRMPYE